MLDNRIREMMPDLKDALKRLVAWPSVSFPGFPEEPVRGAREATLEVLREAGFINARPLDLGRGYPAVIAEVQGPPSSPTVLLYAHYDVQPAPADQVWETDPWTLTERPDGRLAGRGSADNKSGIVIHAGTLRAFEGKPPVNVKLIVEGEEETLSNLESYIEEHPEEFQADVMVVADMGNILAGEPVITTTLRGTVVCAVEVTTLRQPLHSGIFGGPVPDALVILIKTLATLWDENGDTAIKGLRSFEWTGAGYPSALLREQAGLLPGLEMTGTGSLASRLWSKPSVTVIGLDAPDTAQAGNALIPRAKARLSLRIAPGENPADAVAAVKRHLDASVPTGFKVSVDEIMAADPFTAPAEGPAVAAALEALREAYGKEPGRVGSGGTIPLLKRLSEAAPQAEFVLWGAADSGALIHGANESVDPKEIERIIAAQALLLAKLGAPE